ncbi:hypothetical protein JZ751_005385, partial [Albula glossodonta]
CLAVWLCFCSLWGRCCGEIRYSVNEEANLGTIIGNLAKDLGIQARAVADRRFRIVPAGKRELFQLAGAQDPDVGVNALRSYRLSQNEHFELKVEDLSENKIPVLVLQKPLDRELVPVHELILTAFDGGNPARTDVLNISIIVLDINDNAPVFDKQKYSVTLSENVQIGTSVIKVNATDLDSGDNGAVEYSLGETAFRAGQRDWEIRVKGPMIRRKTVMRLTYELRTRPLEDANDNKPDIEITSLLKQVPEDGRRNRSNVTVKVFILDQNDNAPVIFSPLSSNGSAEGVEEIPRNVNAGHSVTKVRAYDADIGYNAWLSFSLQHATDASLFGLERYTGQLRTLRSFTETDEAQHKLVIVVKDNGNVSLSATATVIINVVEPKEAFAASDTKGAIQTEEENNVTFYLIITLGSVSALFLLSIIGLIVMQCSKPDYSTKCSRDSNYADMSGNGTLCHSIQYRSGDKRYMLVGPRMSIGSAIVPGSNANTLIVSDHRKRTSGESPPFRTETRRRL